VSTKNRLHEIVIQSIDLVPRGGNKKKIFLKKSGETMGEFTVESLQEIEEIIKEELENEEKIIKEAKLEKISDKAKNAIKSILRLAANYKEEIGDDVMKKLASLAGYGYPAPEKKQDDNDKDKDKEKNPFTKPYPEVKKAARDFVPTDKREEFDKIMKSFEVKDTPVVDDPQVLALMKKDEDSQKRIRKLEQDTEIRKVEVRIEKELKNLNTVPEKFAPLLHTIEKALNDDQKKEFNEILKAADKQAEKGTALLKELGSDQGDPEAGSAYEKIQKIAKEKVKVDPGLTIEKAEMLAMEENTDLYDQYEKEQRN